MPSCMGRMVKVVYSGMRLLLFFGGGAKPCVESVEYAVIASSRC